MRLDDSTCWEAHRARDARFDGKFFTAVASTGIFCRPVCPARTPLRSNCSFFPSAAAALSAGFRPCRRCRPETAPGAPAWNGTSALVTRALRLIDEGALDSASVGNLAERLGVGERQLRRLFREKLGVSPQQAGQARRVLLARRLLDETALPTADIAAAAGFGSVRRFREVVDVQSRRKAQAGGIRLQLAYRPPYDWEAMFSFLGQRMVAPVESIEGGRYRRTFRIGSTAGRLSARPLPEKNALETEIEIADLRLLPPIVARIRRLFDLDADPAAISQALERDPVLAPRVAARPGLRLPGAWDLFEMAVRATLEQQVTVKGAATLTSRLIPASGLFPTPEELLAMDLSGKGLTGARQRALHGLAEAFAADGIPADAPAEALRAALEQIPGIGPWTSHYIALRALGDPDAFPPKDLALPRIYGVSNAELLDAAEAWRPWRAYAAMYLWTPLPL